MRTIKLTGRELTVVRAIGFTEAALGSDILEITHMVPEDVTDTLNSLLSAGFAESSPYHDQVEMTEMPATAFELNPAYVHQLKIALLRR